MLTTYIIGIIVCLLVYLPYTYHMREEFLRIVHENPAHFIWMSEWKTSPWIPLVQSLVVSLLWPALVVALIWFVRKNFYFPSKEERHDRA